MSDRPEPSAPYTLLVGAGRMGSALLRGWARQGISPLAAVEPTPGPDLRAWARRHNVQLIADTNEAIGLSISTCVVAVKPQILRSEASQLRPIAQSGALMVSIAAGMSIRGLRGHWGARAKIIRAMPNLPGAVGRGISALYAPRATSACQRRQAETLLAGLGDTFWVDREELIDVVTAVSGSGPAYVFLFGECLAEAARAEGLPPDLAERLGRATISGAGALLDNDKRNAAMLRRDVTSPGGTTEAALKVFVRNDSLGKLVTKAVAAARKRAEQLRREGEA